MSTTIPTTTTTRTAPSACRALPLACSMSRTQWEKHTSSIPSEYASSSSMGRFHPTNKPAGVPLERTQRVSNYSFNISMDIGVSTASANELSSIPMKRQISSRSRLRLEHFTIHSVEASTKPQGVPLERTQRVSNFSCVSSTRCPPVSKQESQLRQFDAKDLDSQEIIHLLATRLSKLAEANDKNPSKSPRKSFTSSKSWSSLMSAAKAQIDESPATFSVNLTSDMISIEEYLMRICEYCEVGNAVLIALLVYFDRMARLGKSLNSFYSDSAGFVVDSSTVHRLVLTGILVASKYFVDVTYTAGTFAEAGCIPVKELTTLQMLFLGMNNFELGISAGEMKKYSDDLFASPTSTASLLPVAAAEDSAVGDIVGGGKVGKATRLNGRRRAIVTTALRAKNAFRKLTGRPLRR